MIALRTPATTAWLGAGASEYDIEGVSALRMLTAVAGIRRVHSRAWTSELELGAARVVRRGVGQPTLEPAARVGVTATRAREASDTELRLHLARDFATTGTVELAHRSGPHRLTAALDLALEAQGGVFTDVTHDRRLRVELQEALPARTVLSTGWSVGRAHTLGVGDVSATSGRAWVVATRKLMSAVEVGLGWQLIEQSTTQAGVHRGYRGARTTLSVAVVPR